MGLLGRHRGSSSAATHTSATHSSATSLESSDEAPSVSFPGCLKVDLPSSSVLRPTLQDILDSIQEER